MTHTISRRRAVTTVALAGLLASFVMLPALSSSATAASSLRHAGTASPNLPTGHFLYADNGLSTTNSISGYSINPDGSLTPTPGSPYATGGSQTSSAFVNDIATALNSPGGRRCVFHTDASGQVESFTVAANGALREINSISIADGVNAFAGDVHVSADGTVVYAAAWAKYGSPSPSVLATFTVGPVCSIRLAQNLAVSNTTYFSTALIAASTLMAVDSQNARIDIYSITDGTALRRLTSTPTQLKPEPQGAASALVGTTTYVFNGLATFASSFAEAHTVDARGTLDAVPGSPASDPAGEDGAVLWFDQANGQLVEGEGFTLGFFGVKNGTLTFLGHAALTTPYFSSAMTQLGTHLYVVSQTSPPIESCVLSYGAARCTQAARLPGGSDGSDGIGVL